MLSSGLLLCFFCRWCGRLHPAVIFSSYCSSLQPNVEALGIKNQHPQIWDYGSQLEKGLMPSLDLEWDATSSRETVPRTRSKKMSWVLFTTEGRMKWVDQQKYWYGICSNANFVPVCCGQERAELKDKSLCFAAELCSDPHLWVWVVGNDWENDTAEWDWKEFPQ